MPNARADTGNSRCTLSRTLATSVIELHAMACSTVVKKGGKDGLINEKSKA